MKKSPFPRLLSWVVITGLLFLLFMTIMRFVFFYRFHSAGTSAMDYPGPFLMGIKYDLRIVCGAILFPFLVGSMNLTKKKNGKLTSGSYLTIAATILLMAGLLAFMKKGHMQTAALIFFAVLFILILAWLFLTKNCNPFENKISERIIKAWFIFVSSVLVLFYGADLEHYDYLRQRLSAGVLDYGEDVSISLRMIWETYPVFSIITYLVVCIGLFTFLINLLFRKIAGCSFSSGPKSEFLLGFLFTAASALGIYGRINQYPLRWSDAFDFRDDFKANLALNPIQSFLSTIQYRHSGYSMKLVKQDYPMMAEYLGVENPDPDGLDYTRSYRPTQGAPKRNVVIVICESFSMYKSSMGGNKLNTTPYFDSLCRSGIFFDRCFTPSYGTARGVWATITGIPDVSYPNTSSRNPNYVDQHSIINDYDGYSKYYFIGGSSSWANIRGLLSNNLSGLNLLEEENFKAQRVDVWGISDKRLLLAANDTLAKQTKPFIAIIQTADNHRPYTIPEEDREEFRLVSYPKDTLSKYGFSGNEELNAFRYTDFTFRKFVEAAQKEPYFKNTLFVFVGDHGINGNMQEEYPPSWEKAGLAIHHVPLLFYAPGFLAPQNNNRISSQIDVLPTASAIAGIRYTNTTLGSNLLDSTQKIPSLGSIAFTYDPTLRKIGLVSDSFIYNYNLISSKENIFSLSNNNLPDKQQVQKMRHLTSAWYQTSQYLLSHNQKRKTSDKD